MPAGSVGLEIPPAAAGVMAKRLALSAIIAIHGLFSWHFTSGSYFFADDWLNFALARESGLQWSYIRRGIFGHFVPAHRFADLVIQRYFPFRWHVALAFLIACSALAIVALWRILRTLLGDTWVPIMIVAPLSTTILMLPSQQWWATGLTQLPAIAFTLWCIDSFLRYAMTARLRYLLLSIATFAASLLWYEKAVLVMGYLPLLVGVVLGERIRVKTVVREVARQWRVFGPMALITAVYLWIYFTEYYYALPRPSAGELTRFFGIAWFKSFGPGLLGIRPSRSLLGSPTVAVIAGQVTIIGLALWTMVRRRRTGRAWLFFAFVFITNVGLVGYARVASFGVDVGRDYRYLVENAFFLLLTLGFALARPRRNDERSGTDNPNLAASSAAHTFSPSRRLIAGLVVVWSVVAALGWRSASTIRDQWPARDSRAYVTNLVAGVDQLRARATSASIVSDDVPFGIVAPAFLPYNRFETFLPLVSQQVDLPFNDTRRELFTVDTLGMVRPAVFAPLSTTTSATLDRFSTDQPGIAPEVVAGSVCVDNPPQTTVLVARLDPPVEAEQIPADRELFVRVSVSPADTQRDPHLYADHGVGLEDLTGDFRLTTVPPAMAVVIDRIRRGPVISVGISVEPGASICVSDVQVGLYNPG